MKQSVIESWDERARAYRDLVERYEVFGALAERLVAALPSDFAGPALDLMLELIRAALDDEHVRLFTATDG